MTWPIHKDIFFSLVEPCNFVFCSSTRRMPGWLHDTSVSTESMSMTLFVRSERFLLRYVLRCAQ
jgi:hypothetical protein